MLRQPAYLGKVDVSTENIVEADVADLAIIQDPARSHALSTT